MHLPDGKCVQTPCSVSEMRLSLISALGFAYGAFAQSGTVSSYISTESPAAKAGVLANIGSDGSKSSGADVRPPTCLLSF